MANFEPPSFSLGLDFDFDSEPRRPDPYPSCNIDDPAEKSSTKAANVRTIEENDDDFETSPTQFSEPSWSLKRLRRGPTSDPTLSKHKGESKREWFDADDEIEDFSSQEDPPGGENAPKHPYSVCSSSKLPLHGHGVLASQSSNQWKARKKNEVSNASVSAVTPTTGNKFVFPELTVSPLRRFQLIDSDSDDTSLDEGLNDVVNQVDSSLNDRESNLNQVASGAESKKTKASVIMSQPEDLRKEIQVEKSFHIPTPAFDEVCEEYFRSVKQKTECQSEHESPYQTSNIAKNDVQHCDLGPLPPSHQYYFHEDPRIQKLVRARLPNFLPLGAVSNQGHKQQNACTIDYMSQFSHGEASKQAKKKQKNEPSSTRSRKNARKPNGQEVSRGSDSWVNPRSCAGISKDAGKRRVHAVGKSSGHWYTANDGRRLYVARNGEELAGQIAYRQYRRESGAGFKRSKKKSTAKKKTASKKK